MCYVRRALALAVLCCVTAPVCAFTLSYGTGIKIRGVETKSGQLFLPVTRKKYRNVKIVSKQLFQFAQQCADDCMYPAQEVKITSLNGRRAFTNDKLVIAEVELNQELLLTFLVFKQTNGVSVKGPEEVRFTDRALQNNLEKQVAEMAGTL